MMITRLPSYIMLHLLKKQNYRDPSNYQASTAGHHFVLLVDSPIDVAWTPHFTGYIQIFVHENPGFYFSMMLWIVVNPHILHLLW